VECRVFSMGGVIGGIISSTPMAVPKVAAPQRVRVSSGVSQGFLVGRKGGSPSILPWRAKPVFRAGFCCKL